MATPKVQIPPERLSLYEALVKTNPEIERKGATMPYTSVNGNMFSFLSSDGVLGLRLAKADREAFISKYGAVLMEAQGRVMQEYVRVPETLLENTAELQQYLRLSFDYASTLKPKATTKKT